MYVHWAQKAGVWNNKVTLYTVQRKTPAQGYLPPEFCHSCLTLPFGYVIRLKTFLVKTAGENELQTIPSLPLRTRKTMKHSPN